ncbi:uncharacterized protein BDV17DRAFT_263443 [Aspergillus undulatus]|uniref:uncharacterized protein n=1 Tax=Aspergillus undulatus TaxID=1810928 RepID=UPI003CCD5BC8
MGHSHPTTGTDFVIFEWTSATARKQFLDSELSRPFRAFPAFPEQLQTMRGRTVTTNLIRKIDDLQDIHASAWAAPGHFEIWTVYFPATRSQEMHSYLKRINGPLFWIPNSLESDDRLEAMRGLLHQSHGWMVGNAKFQKTGQVARRMIYIFTWESEAAEERYKRELRCDGWEILLQGLPLDRFG